MALNDLSIRALPVPERGQKTYWDTLRDAPGFGVRVSHGGTRTFVLMHGRSRTLTTIGRVGVISLKDARIEAKRILAQRTLGRFHAPSDISFGEAVEEFLATHDGKESTKDEYRSLIKRHFLPKLRLDRLDRIQTTDLTRIIDKLGDRTAEASHAHAAASVVFNWARSRRYIDRSPLDGVKKPFQGPPRERVLTDEEVTAIFRVEDPPPIGLIIQLILLTGQRPGQIGEFRADYLMEDRIAWPAAAMKWPRKYANRQHVIPLLPIARGVIGRLPRTGFLFPSRRGGAFTNWSNGKRLFDESLGLSDYTCQDCRRTTATKLGELEVLPHVIDNLQAHRFRGLSNVHAIYNKAVYFEPMRDALHRWEHHIQGLLAQQEGEDGHDSLSGNRSIHNAAA